MGLTCDFWLENATGKAKPNAAVSPLRRRSMKLSTASVEITILSRRNGRQPKITADPWLVVFALGVGEGVVAFAGLDLLAGLAGDVEGAEGAVDFGIGGGEAGEVLGAELVLDLVKGFL